MVSPEILRRYPYFGGAREEVLQQVAAASQERVYEAEDTLFQEGQPAKYACLILEGEVDVVAEMYNGQQKVVDTVVAGEMACWSALIPPHQITCTGCAKVDTKCVLLDAHILRGLCEQDNAFGFELMTQLARTLVHRLRGARTQLAAVS